MVQSALGGQIPSPSQPGSRLAGLAADESIIYQKLKTHPATSSLAADVALSDSHLTKTAEPPIIIWIKNRFLHRSEPDSPWSIPCLPSASPSSPWPGKALAVESPGRCMRMAHRWLVEHTLQRRLPVMYRHV